MYSHMSVKFVLLIRRVNVPDFDLGGGAHAAVSLAEDDLGLCMRQERMFWVLLLFFVRGASYLLVQKCLTDRARDSARRWWRGGDGLLCHGGCLHVREMSRRRRKKGGRYGMSCVSINWALGPMSWGRKLASQREMRRPLERKGCVTKLGK